MKSLSRVLLFSISISLLWISPTPGSDLTHRSKTEPAALETAPATQQSSKTTLTPKTAPGYCCIKGTIVSSDERSCRARKGRYAKNKKDILKICQPTRGERVAPKTAPVNGYCCSDGAVLSTNSLVCEKRKGSFFRSRQEADRKCGETAGYCCKSGEYKESTKRDCAKVRGVFTRDKQKGFAACQATIGFCCIRGKVLQLSRGQCDQKKGSFSSFREKAEKVCLSTPGFCCTNGKVLSANRQECDRKSGTFHSDRAAALRTCQPQLSDPKGKPGPPPSSTLTRQGSQAAGVSAQAVVLSLQPDLVVLKTSLGKDCKLRVSVKNQGGPIGEAEHSQAEVYISAGPGNVLSPRKRYLRVIDPDKKLKTAGAEVTYVSDLLVSGTQSTLVWLDTAHHIAESNEQNNGDDQEVSCEVAELALPQPIAQQSPPEVSGQGAPVDGPPPPQPHYPPNHGHLEVTSPQQGEFFSGGQQHDIVWDVHGYLTTDCAQIFLYQDNTQVYPITWQVLGRDIPGQAGFQWNVPQHLAGSYTVQVRTCDGEAEDFSDPFLIISPEPDLVISNVSITPATPTSNDTIRFRAAVTNMGHTVADSSRGVLTVRDPDGIEHTFTMPISTLGFGAHTYIQKEYKVNRGGTYEHTLNVEVVLSTALETHLDNNEASTTVTIQGVPDLVVCFDTIMTGEVYYYQDIYGYVRNIGDGQAGATNVSVWVEGKGTSSYSVPILVSSQTEYINRSNLLWALDGNRGFYFNVDPGDAITERYEDNNQQHGIIKIHGCTLLEMAIGDCDPPDDPYIYRCSGIIPVYNQPYTVVEVN